MDKRSIPYLALGGVYGDDDVEAARAVISAAASPGGRLLPASGGEAVPGCVRRPRGRGLRGRGQLGGHRARPLHDGARCRAGR